MRPLTGFANVAEEQVWRWSWMLEELGDRLEYSEIFQLAEKLKKLSETQTKGLRVRAESRVSKYLTVLTLSN